MNYTCGPGINDCDLSWRWSASGHESGKVSGLLAGASDLQAVVQAGNRQVSNHCAFPGTGYIVRFSAVDLNGWLLTDKRQVNTPKKLAQRH